MLNDIKKLVDDIDTLKKEISKYHDLFEEISSSDSNKFKFSLNIESVKNDTKEDVKIEEDSQHDFFMNYIKQFQFIYPTKQSDDSKQNNSFTIEINDVTSMHIFGYILADKKLKLDTKIKELAKIMNIDADKLLK